MGAARASVDEATGQSTDAILDGRRMLLGLNVLSIIGAVLIAWLFVGGRDTAPHRPPVRPHATHGGRRPGSGSRYQRDDEVAEMAAALEVFRRHALEVQRLNLVGKLAEELQEKNAAIEKALADLHEAQDQIIASQKLAELGELTARCGARNKEPAEFREELRRGIG